MKEKVLAHIGSLMGGLVHNLNTPLMWIMGRAQLIQSRNEKLGEMKDLTEEDLSMLKEKNGKDIHSIQEGADKIDQILKALAYKIQMINEGYTSIELKEYLEMEINFLMADMHFKHETKREVKLDSRSCYVRSDYCALSYAFTGIINTIISSTEKGRTMQVALDNGTIRIGCPELGLSPEVKQEVENICCGIKERADIAIDGTNGFEVSLWIKDS
jgi:two-component system, NtrC family, sensor kinase